MATNSPAKNNNDTPSDESAEKKFARTCSLSSDGNNFLVNTLDEMERRVEALRDNAKKMEDERTMLLGSLNTLLQSQALLEVSEAEQEELELFIDRLTKRCLTIEVTVHIVRSTSQEKSLQTVLGYLKQLIALIHTDIEQSQTTIQRYLNSCLPDTRGPVDDKFQASLLGCTAEDQKDVRGRLEGLRNSIERESGGIICSALKNKGNAKKK